ncbi:MBL fold metallo-hydrolase [Pseudoduganella violaceinigra]|uniref:MBL fold metallo-hydrolase n=1 Tax=Pseudoduganella violaceinigra TaxID=246602 RepID=UPI00040B4D97|nr:MBL fold metallo-hydrolase [Pseudoduganella violaceinigra]
MKRIIAAALLAVAAQAPLQAAEQAPGFYRATLGDFKVTALSDGVAQRDVTTILSDAETARKELRANHLHDTLPLSINVYLVDTGKQRVLVDTGAGELFGASSGHLLANLAAAGYKPEQIDAVLLTHIHGDHSGGLSIGGKRLFPNALVYVDRREVAHWMNQPAPKATVGPYADAGRINYLPESGEVLPGISARPVPGHTPGHTAYLVESKGHRMLFWGDTVHVAEVQLAHPAITIAYDSEQPQAAAERRKLFEEAAASGVLVASPHFSFPGMGHLRKDGDAFRWVPVAYNDQVTELAP